MTRGIHFQHLRSSVLATSLALVFTLYAVPPAQAGTIIVTDTVSPVLGSGDNDVTGSIVTISGDPSSLTVDGGSNLTADAVFAAGGPADVTTILFTGAGTTVDLVGDDVGFTNRIDIGGQGSASMTIADGAVVDTKSAACTSGACNIFVGNFTGSTGTLTITGAGSRLDGQDAFVIGQSRVTNIATEGFDAGIPGGTTNGTLNVLDGGVLNTESSTLAREAGGPNALGSEQAIVTATVGGAGSQWNITGADARLNIADGANSTATLTINAGGKVKVETTGSTARVNVSANGLNGGGTGDLNISGTNSELLITSDSGSAQLDLGRAGVGTLDMNSNATLAIESTSGGARIFIAGSPTTPANADGTANIDNSTVSVTAGGATSAFISVGRDLGTGALNLTGGTVVTVDNTGSGFSFVDIGRSAAGGDATVSGGSSLVVKATGTGTSSITIGRNVNAVGTMTVTGAGSSVTVEDVLSVGRDGGTGTLNVENSATFTNTASSGLTRIGRGGGTGTLNVSSGGIFAASNLQLGRDADSDGTVTVTGVGSAVNVTNTIMVGRINTGTFNVLAGGTVTASSLQLGREAGSEGNMTVTGTDSAVNVSNVVTVGYGNTGATNASTLNIGDGTTGSVTAQAAVVGRSEGSSGVLNISGGGASLALSGLSGAGNGRTLLAGRFGTGVVNVTNGADLTVDAVIDPTGSRGGLLLGGTSADDLVTTGDGTLNVDGAGSTVIIAHDRAVATIDRQATGAMNITNGGVVTMTNGAAIGNAFSTVGRKSTGVGTVTVDGVGSIWNAGQNLFLGTEVDFSVAGGAALGGGGGTATVTVSNGGVINVADTVYVDDGATLQGNGTVNGNIFVAAGGLLGPGLSPGTLIIDGDLIIETGATIVLEDFIFGKDELVVSGQVVIQAGAIVEIVIDDLDRLGGVINVDSFFTVSSPTDIQFDPTTSFVFSVLDTSDADDDFTFEIGGTSYDFTFAGGSTSFAAVPEPVSLALFGLGLGAMVVIRRRRKVA